MEIISDYEEIFKLKEFAADPKKRLPFENTYERLRNDLKNQYIENLDKKLERWLNITKAPFFQDVIPVRFYIQAKMLYREGFYEAAITVSRGICEMICQNLLSKITHPFGTDSDIEEENFRTLINFLAVPKEIEKKDFEENLVNKVTKFDDRNFVKSSYEYAKDEKVYRFKINVGKNPTNSKRLFKIFKDVGFENKDIFTNETFQNIHDIYDLGNVYIHARKSTNDTETDAFNMVDGIGYILFKLYGIEKLSAGQTLISAYSYFPDICSGVCYWIEGFTNPEDAMRGYHNMPSKKQIESLLNAKGIWKGEWKEKSQENSKGKLSFETKGEYITSTLEIFGEKNKTFPLSIQLFGDYFRLSAYKDKTKVVEFELSFLNDQIMLGKTTENQGNVFFQKIT